MSDAVEIKNISFSFNTPLGEHFVLNNISFSVAKGEFVTIAGPSGCGKPPCCGQLTGYWNRYAGFGPITVPVTEQMDIVQLRH